MKVLHLIDSGGLYGAEKMLLDLVQEQVESGMKPMILSAADCLVSKKQIEVEAERRGIPIMRWNMKPGLNLKEAYRIKSWAENEGYKIFHSHGFKFNILLALIPRFIRSTPVVTTLHGYVNARPWKKIWLYEFLDQYLLHVLDRVCLVTDKMNRYPKISRLSSQKKVVIPNGIRVKDEVAIDDEFQKKYSDELSSTFNLLFVGRLSPEKNLKGLILALSKVSHDNLRLWVFGDGSLKKELKELVMTLGLEQRVLFIGYVDDARSLMPTFDLLVMPSLTEGLPITLLEALWAGLPVLASKVGDVPDVLDDGEYGFLIDSLNPQELASQIDKIVLNDSLLQSFRIKGKERVRRIYSSKKMSDSYLDVYNTALE